jgi:protein TonB
MNMREPWSEDDVAVKIAAPRANWAMRVGLATALLVVIATIAWAAYALLGDSKPTKKQVVQISLIKPPPPPPPPPPPEQKKIEPEVKEEVKIPEPQEQPQQDEPAPPVSEQLGLDSDGTGNGDGFGLAAKKGGTDITKIGGPSGAGGSERAYFAGLVQSHLQTELSKNERLRRADYKVGLRIWFTPDGRIERFELAGSTGNPQIDQDLKLALDHVPAMKHAPPQGIQQPVKLRLTSRGAG